MRTLANERAKKYKIDLDKFPQKGFDNSECIGDSRNVKGSDGKVFKGLRLYGKQ